jgi:hypothetical protein
MDQVERVAGSPFRSRTVLIAKCESPTELQFQLRDIANILILQVIPLIAAPPRCGKLGKRLT